MILLQANSKDTDQHVHSHIVCFFAFVIHSLENAKAEHASCKIPVFKNFVAGKYGLNFTVQGHKTHMTRLIYLLREKLNHTAFVFSR